ncbi:MAG: hypothetical protein ACE5HC_14085 [Candidatus Binatia bacterium]
MKRAATAFALALILTGCVAYSLVEPRRTSIGDLYTVDPQIAWSSTSQGKVEVWTVDGPTLQAIRFVKGLETDEVLFEAKDEEKRPKFRKHMTPSEIMEFVVDSLTVVGAQKLQATNLRPEKFGSVQGFRFEMRFASKEGLEEQGFVIGAVVEERLHLIMYMGIREHYYPKHKDHVEQIIQSIQMQGEGA